MLLPIKAFSKNETILSGAEAGRRLFGTLVANAPAPLEPDQAFLDFTGVEVATSSFLRESVIAFRDYARSTLPNLYPVIANILAAVEEELAFLLRHRADAMWACNLDERGLPVDARLIGELDEVQRHTFDRVRDLGSASAPTLAAQNGRESGIGATAWNNRLSNLAARGLLIERRGGKTKTFTPVVGGGENPRVDGGGYRLTARPLGRWPAVRKDDGDFGPGMRGCRRLCGGQGLGCGRRRRRRGSEG